MNNTRAGPRRTDVERSGIVPLHHSVAGLRVPPAFPSCPKAFVFRRACQPLDDARGSADMEGTGYGVQRLGELDVFVVSAC